MVKSTADRHRPQPATWPETKKARIPVDEGAPWLEMALTLMQDRGWLVPVPGWPRPTAVAEHVEYQREDDENYRKQLEELDREPNPIDQLNLLRAAGRDDDALALLMTLVDDAEKHAAMHGDHPPPAEWTERAAALLRRRGDREGEIALLRRYVAACPPEYGVRRLFDRLAKLAK